MQTTPYYIWEDIYIIGLCAVKARLHILTSKRFYYLKYKIVIVNAGVFIELSINRIFVDEPETYPDPCFVRILLCGQHNPQKITSIRLPLSVTICTEMTLKVIAFSKLTSWDQTKRWSILSRVKLASQQSHQNLNSDLFIQKFLGIDVMSFLYNKRTLFQVLICCLTKYVGCFYFMITIEQYKLSFEIESEHVSCHPYARIFICNVCYTRNHNIFYCARFYTSILQTSNAILSLI